MEGMSFIQEVVLFIITLGILVGLDSLWLGVVAKARYQKALKKFLVKDFVPTRVAVSYAVYALGLLIMALIPAVNEDSLGIAMFRGAAFGFFAYATCGLTKWATIEKWPSRITFSHIAWGTFLAWTTSVIAYNVYAAVYF